MVNRRNRKGTGTSWINNGRYYWKLRYTDSLTGQHKTKSLSAVLKSELNKKIKSFLNSLEQDNCHFENIQ